MTAATCKVLRDGKPVILPSVDLVPGDVVLLEAGDAVPADGRILESASLKIEEAALTGESVPVNKVLEALGAPQEQTDIPLGDRKNMCYMGSTVVYGRGKAVITATGMATEMGKIAGVISAAKEEQTPLQKKLDDLGGLLSKMVLGICVFLFAFNLFMARGELAAGGHALEVILKTFMVAVSLAVAAIPEGLATVVTVVLSIGVTKMAKENAIIRRLTAVETLGCTQVICSDKTGTLTQNKMTVVEYIGEKALVASAMALCSDAFLNSENKAEGEPTECALVNFACDAGLKKQELEARQPRVGEAPFDSGRKMMSTIHRAVMITGDHKDTAVAIAKELGILADASQAITGTELDSLSDEQLLQKVQETSVYARVQPEHKTRIVNAWKSLGAVTAMTGDGVNDAPSIKSADIGIGIGITGTDVTKNVADMVLADDNFATIVLAVKEGRRIYENIRKAIQFLLASNMSEVLGVFAAAMLGFTLLNPVHLLFINLITDCFPALALGMEKAEANSMRRPPRSAKEGFFSSSLLVDILYQGILVSALTIISYLIGHFFESGVFSLPVGSSRHGMTMAFLTMSMCEIFHSFNLRSQRKSVFSLRGQNKVLWGAMIGSLILTTALLEIPFLANAFVFTPVGWTEYGIALGLAFLVIPIVEVVKFIQRRHAGQAI